MHYVQRAYLKNFACDEKKVFIWVFNKYKRVLSDNPKRIRDIAKKFFYYPRDLETWFGNNIEDKGIIARISEVLNIELKNLDLQNRWFSVVVKSRKTDKRQGVYFFPAFLVPILEHYIKALKIEYSEPIYLFQSEISHLVSKTIEAHLREVKKALGLKAKVNPHAYRDFLNTRRYELGCRSPFL